LSASIERGPFIATVWPQDQPAIFVDPPLQKAAIDGRLPRGFGAKRLMDLPMAWSDQWSTLELKASA